MVEPAPDDIVETFEAAAANSRPPLVVTKPLEAFFDAHGQGSGTLSVRPIGDGHSNATFLIERQGWRAVLRRPPRPPIPPSAHDVLREARVIGALAGRARVPEIIHAVEDESIIGAPFIVMSYVEGYALTDHLPEEISSMEDRRRIGEQLIDTLVELHAVDWREAGLEGFGKPTGYVSRQVRRFTGLWEHNKTREVPDIEALGAWLGENLPDSPPATIVHGDYRLGNVLFAPRSPATLVAILDWELATIGDPLADVGYLTMLWSDRDDPPGGNFDMSPITREPGFPSRAEMVDRYSELSGRSTDDITWYQVLALWKAAVFMEGNYKRAIAGQSDDPFLLEFGERVLELAALARRIAKA